MSLLQRRLELFIAQSSVFYEAEKKSCRFTALRSHSNAVDNIMVIFAPVYH